MEFKYNDFVHRSPEVRYTECALHTNDGIGGMNGMPLIFARSTIVIRTCLCP